MYFRIFLDNQIVMNYVYFILPLAVFAAVYMDVFGGGIRGMRDQLGGDCSPEIYIPSFFLLLHFFFFSNFVMDIKES